MSEPIRNLRDAEVRLGRLRQEWDSFKASNYDRKGLRLINNGRSVDIGDYVIRGEVNDLIIDALQNLDKFEIKQVFTNATGGTGLQNPLVESIRASLDSTYNIGEPALGNRIRWIFSDVTNSEILEVTDVATHLLHWQFLQDPATSNELDLKDPTNAILATFSTQAIESFQSIILGNDGAANIRPLQMRHPTTGVSNILTMDWATSNVALNSPEELLVLASYNPTPNLTGAVELYTRDDSTVIFRPSSLGGIPISNYFLGDLNVPWLEIYATQVSATFQTGLIPLVRWDDQSGGNNFAYFLGPIGGGTTWIVELPNVGPNAGDVLADSGIISTGGAHRLVWTPAGGGGASLPVVDSTSIVEGSSDATKELRFEVDGFTSGAVRVMTPPNANATLAGINLAQTWTAAQTMQSILASADSTYDIGQSGASNRFRWGFADVWNAEMLEITNSTHTTHWSFKQQSGDTEVLNLIETDGVSVFAKFDLNTASAQPFMEIDADIFPLTDQTRQVGMATGSSKIFSSIAARSLRAGKTGASGTVFISPSGGGSAVSITADSNGFIFTDSLQPNAHNFDTLGLSTRMFANAFLTKATLGKSSATRLQGILEISNATDSNVAQLLGISKDGVGTMEVSGSLAMGTSANFYGRVYTGGDVNCTGIDDGWMGFRTDTNELQVCIGGTMVAVTLS